MKLKQWTITAGATLIAGACLTAADATDEIGALKKQIQELDQKVKAMERNRELDAEAAQAKTKESPRLSVGQDGVRFSSPDTNFALKLGAHVQADARFFLGDHIPVNDTFLLRRVRPILEGTVFRDI